MFLKEFIFAFRQLRKSLGFSALAILTLALGIGVSTAMFTIVDSVLLNPLSYRDSGRLVIIWERVKFLGIPYIGANPRHFDLWQKRASAFSELTLLQERVSGVSLGAGHPQLAGMLRAYPNLLKVLQVQPMLGRDFGPENGISGKDKVVILSYALWQSLFHGDPAVIGKTLRVSDVPREVIGVLPKSFHFPNANALAASPSGQSSGRAPTPALIVPAALNLNRIRLERRVWKLDRIGAFEARSERWPGGVGAEQHCTANRARNACATKGQSAECSSGVRAAHARCRRGWLEDGSMAAHGGCHGLDAHCLRELGERSTGPRAGARTGTRRTKCAGRGTLATAMELLGRGYLACCRRRRAGRCARH